MQNQSNCGHSIEKRSNRHGVFLPSWKKITYLSVDVFSKKVLIEGTIFASPTDMGLPIICGCYSKGCTRLRLGLFLDFEGWSGWGWNLPLAAPQTSVPLPAQTLRWLKHSKLQTYNYLSYDPYGPASAFFAKPLMKVPYEGRTHLRERGRKKAIRPCYRSVRPRVFKTSRKFVPKLAIW